MLFSDFVTIIRLLIYYINIISYRNFNYITGREKCAKFSEASLMVISDLLIRNSV